MKCGDDGGLGDKLTCLRSRCRHDCNEVTWSHHHWIPEEPAGRVLETGSAVLLTVDLHQLINMLPLPALVEDPVLRPDQPQPSRPHPAAQRLARHPQPMPLQQQLSGQGGTVARISARTCSRSAWACAGSKQGSGGHAPSRKQRASGIGRPAVGCAGRSTPVPRPRRQRYGHHQRSPPARRRGVSRLHSSATNRYPASRQLGSMDASARAGTFLYGSMRTMQYA